MEQLEYWAGVLKRVQDMKVLGQNELHNVSDLLLNTSNSFFPTESVAGAYAKVWESLVCMCCSVQQRAAKM